jgi:hypothetical protein
VTESISLLVRRSGLTHEQFVRCRVDVHAAFATPLARAVYADGARFIGRIKNVYGRGARRHRGG